jgi:outer membrane protein
LIVLPLLILTKTKMKKIILTAAAVFAFSFANAQDKKDGFGFSKGDFTVGGNIAYESEDGDSTTLFAPSLSYFVSDKMSINASLASLSGDGIESTTSFGIGMNYYMLDLGERFKVYSTAGLGFGEDITSFNAGVGVNYFLTSRLTLNFGLANMLSYQKVGDEDATTTINLNQYDNFFDNTSFGLTFIF